MAVWSMYTEKMAAHNDRYHIISSMCGFRENYVWQKVLVIAAAVLWFDIIETATNTQEAGLADSGGQKWPSCMTVKQPLKQTWCNSRQSYRNLWGYLPLVWNFCLHYWLILCNIDRSVFLICLFVCTITAVIRLLTGSKFLISIQQSYVPCCTNNIWDSINILCFFFSYLF